jgi:hypothetical protein
VVSLIGSNLMAFRADEAAINGLERAKAYLIPRQFSPADRARGETVLLDIIDQCGPVVDGYPTWHPLVVNHKDECPETGVNERCGYKGLDHTIYFEHGFVTCPYHDGGRVIDSVSELPYNNVADITAEKLECQFYNDGVTPILVRCVWRQPLDIGLLIPKRLAVPLMLEKEVPCWRWASRAETWETMRPYLLGAPHGNRSSLFVSQETALAMKRVYMAMVESGMFGPLKMG